MLRRARGSVYWPGMNPELSFNMWTVPRTYIVQSQGGSTYRRNRINVRPTPVTPQTRDSSPIRATLQPEVNNFRNNRISRSLNSSINNSNHKNHLNNSEPWNTWCYYSKITKHILSSSRTTDSRTASPDPTDVSKTNSRRLTSSVHECS